MNKPLKDQSISELIEGLDELLAMKPWDLLGKEPEPEQEPAPSDEELAYRGDYEKKIYGQK